MERRLDWYSNIADEIPRPRFDVKGAVEYPGNKGQQKQIRELVERDERKFQAIQNAPIYATKQDMVYDLRHNPHLDFETFARKCGIDTSQGVPEYEQRAINYGDIIHDIAV